MICDLALPEMLCVTVGEADALALPIETPALSPDVANFGTTSLTPEPDEPLVAAVSFAAGLPT